MKIDAKRLAKIIHDLNEDLDPEDDAGPRKGVRWVAEAIGRELVAHSPDSSWTEFVESCGVKVGVS